MRRGCALLGRADFGLGLVRSRQTFVRLSQGAPSPPHCNRNEKMRGISGKGLEINSHSRPGGGWGGGAPARAMLCAQRQELGQLS